MSECQQYQTEMDKRIYKQFGLCTPCARSTQLYAVTSQLPMDNYLNKDYTILKSNCRLFCVFRSEMDAQLDFSKGIKIMLPRTLCCAVCVCVCDLSYNPQSEIKVNLQNCVFPSINSDD